MATNFIAAIAGALSFLEDALDYQQTYLTGVWTVHLFDNNYTIVSGTTLGDVNESSWPGYSAATPTWAAPTTIGGVPQTISSNCTFTQTSSFPSTNYGVYLTDAANTKWKGGSNFASPVVLTASQPSYVLTVTVTTKSEF